LQQEVASGYLKIGDVEGDPYGANLGDTTKAIASYGKGLAIAQSVVARNPGDLKAKQVLGWAHFQIAGVLAVANKRDEAFQHSSEALKIYQELAAHEPDNLEARLNESRAWERQGDLLGGVQSINMGRKQEAAAAYQKALSLIPDLPKDHPLTSRATRGKVLLQIKLVALRGNRTGPEILDGYKAALRMAEDASRNNPNDNRARELVSYVLNKIAGTQDSFGDFQGARATYTRAAEIHEAALKADPNNAGERQGTMGFYKNFGDLYFYSLKDWAEALKCYRRAGELMEVEIRSDPNNVVIVQRYSEVLTCIGSCLLRLKQPEEARLQSKRGLDMARELADRPNSPHDHKYNYAWLAVTVEPYDLQEPKRALPYALKAVEMDGGTDEYSLHVVAQAYEGMGDYARAIETEKKGLALFPPAAPGAPKPGMQRIMESLVTYCEEAQKKQSK
jgi:tetratricopeptide (TPR) repeat protein